MRDTQIITAYGAVAKRNQCRKIEGEYYIIGDPNIKDSGECYPIKRKTGNIAYFRKSNIDLVWDRSSSSYRLMSESPFLISAYAQINIVDGSLKFSDLGYYNVNDVAEEEYEGVNVTFHKSQIDKMPKKIWHPTEGRYVIDTPKTRDSITRQLNGGRNHSKIRYKNYRTDIYCYKDLPSDQMEMFQNAVDSAIKEGAIVESEADNFFKNSIGVEIETSIGSIPEDSFPKCQCVPLKDGSISGHEYVTVPLSGKYTVSTLRNLFSEASKYTRADQNCSLHVHYGNLPRTKNFAVSIWKLYNRLQSEIEEIIPPYKRNLHYLMNKLHGAKDHCQLIRPFGTLQKLKTQEDIDKCFDLILTFFADNNGQYPEPYSKKSFGWMHPKHGRNKWEIESRYVTLNLLPFLFSETGGTIEFRVHSGTVSRTKGMMWIFITNAIIFYAMNKQSKILAGEEKITLVDVLESVYSADEELLYEIKDYINRRKDMTFKQATTSLENQYRMEFLDDYKF